MHLFDEQGRLVINEEAATTTVDVQPYVDSKVNIECPDNGINYTVCVKLSAGKPTIFLNGSGTSRVQNGVRQIRCDDDGLYYSLGVKLSAGKPTYYLVTPGEA